MLWYAPYLISLKKSFKVISGLHDEISEAETQRDDRDVDDAVLGLGGVAVAGRGLCDAAGGRR